MDGLGVVVRVLSLPDAVDDGVPKGGVADDVVPVLDG